MLTFFGSMGAYTHGLAEVRIPHASQLVAPIHFPLNLTPTDAAQDTETVEQRLGAITVFIAKACRERDASDFSDLTTVAACLWPPLVRELNEVGTLLSRQSPDPKKLNQTLASRLHPESLFSENQVSDFGNLYARFLLAHRMIREVWPSVFFFLKDRGQFRFPIDHFIGPWMMSETPWGMFRQTLSQLRCATGPAKECILAQKIRRLLKASSDLVDDDPQLKKLARLPVDSDFVSMIKRGGIRAKSDGDQRLNSILDQVFGRDQDQHNLLFLRRDFLASGEPAQAIHSYLKLLKGDLQRPGINISLSPSACTFALSLVAEPTAAMFSSTVAAAVEEACSDRFPKPRLANILDTFHVLRVFQFMQLRAMIVDFYEQADFVPQDFSIHLRGRSMRDIVAALSDARNFGITVGHSEFDEQKEWNKILVNFFYDVVDGDQP